MLAARRPIFFKETKVADAPLIVPSFSSKGFTNIKAIMKSMSEYITESSLVSLYDIHYGHINRRNNFADVLFFDSGGYEATVDTDLSDARRISTKPKAWSHRKYIGALKKLSFPAETTHVLVNYDHPRSRLPYEEQIERARSDFESVGNKGFVSEILFKPEKGSDYLDVAKIVGLLDRSSEFDVIGFTEKELGESTLDRMHAIAQFRLALDKVELNKPIHVFGAFDPISVPLYLVAGADIFDGLTWLRYALHEGRAIYIQNYVNLTGSLDSKQSMAETKTWVDNISSMLKLQLQMRTFTNTRDYSTFEFHSDLIKRASETLKSMLEGN